MNAGSHLDRLVGLLEADLDYVKKGLGLADPGRLARCPELVVAARAIAGPDASHASDLDAVRSAIAKEIDGWPTSDRRRAEGFLGVGEWQESQANLTDRRIVLEGEGFGDPRTQQRAEKPLLSKLARRIATQAAKARHAGRPETFDPSWRPATIPDEVLARFDDADRSVARAMNVLVSIGENATLYFGDREAPTRQRDQRYWSLRQMLLFWAALIHYSAWRAELAAFELEREGRYDPSMPTFLQTRGIKDETDPERVLDDFPEYLGQLELRFLESLISGGAWPFDCIRDVGFAHQIETDAWASRLHQEWVTERLPCRCEVAGDWPCLPHVIAPRMRAISKVAEVDLAALIDVRSGSGVE